MPLQEEAAAIKGVVQTEHVSFLPPSRSPQVALHLLVPGGGADCSDGQRCWWPLGTQGVDCRGQCLVTLSQKGSAGHEQCTATAANLPRPWMPRFLVRCSKCLKVFG